MATGQPNKKSFEFRMSKKVAELTQVVHMLFTRNHEKEVEIDALKDAYEYECEYIIKDARAKLDRAEKRIRELERQLSDGNSQAQNELSELIAKREEEWKKRNEELEQTVRNEKQEAQNCRDLLIKAQKDIETLKREQSNEINHLSRNINDKSKEIDRLKTIIRNLEQNLTDKQQKVSSANELNKQFEKQRKELEQVREQCRSYERAKDQLLSRNKKLETDVSNLKRELNKKVERTNALPPSTSSRPDMNYNEEIDKMRKEIQRYRMELSNRETNFNRMFTEKNPVQVESSSVRKNQMMQQAFENGVIMRLARNKSNLAGHDLNREKSSLSPAKDLSQNELSDSYDSYEHLTNGKSSGRLPHIPNSSDPRSRLHKLVKPRPLPKEIVSNKVGH